MTQIPKNSKSLGDRSLAIGDYLELGLPAAGRNLVIGI
jgi:hypothetical protein